MHDSDKQPRIFDRSVFVWYRTLPALRNSQGKVCRIKQEVLWTYCLYADWDSGEHAFPSMARLIEWVKADRWSIMRARKELVAEGFLVPSDEDMLREQGLPLGDDPGLPVYDVAIDDQGLMERLLKAEDERAARVKESHARYDAKRGRTPRKAKTPRSTASRTERHSTSVREAQPNSEKHSLSDREAGATQITSRSPGVIAQVDRPGGSGASRGEANVARDPRPLAKNERADAPPEVRTHMQWELRVSDLLREAYPDAHVKTINTLAMRLVSDWGGERAWDLVCRARSKNQHIGGLRDPKNLRRLAVELHTQEGATA